MPKLSELVDTDYLPAAEPIPADIPRVYIGNGNAAVEQPLEMPSPASSKINSIINSLFRTDDKRYQLWPEKVIREGLSGAHDVMEQGTNLGLRREDVTDIPKPDMPTKDSTWLGQKLGIAPVAASPQDSIIEKAQAISALAGTGGLGGTDKAAGISLGVVPVDIAKKLKFETGKPNDVLKKAVDNTPNAYLDPDGHLVVGVSRRQMPDQEMAESVRGGVFYLPEGNKGYSYTGKNGYGGSQKVEGETAFKNPLVVKGATGGKAPERAYNELMGDKNAYQNMRTEALRALGQGKTDEAKVYSFLEKYAPEMSDYAGYIIQNSKDGNKLPYALQEAAVASAARKAGHDGVVGYSTKKDGSPFLSEIFDVRENRYPSPSGEYSIHPELYSDSKVGTAVQAVSRSGPFLRPALKYKDRLYKGKEGQQHQDVIPDALYPEFNKMAMSGEDISHYNFGFVNDKGHFLNREDALKYGIDTGLIDPQAGKFGALTSTLMTDSSKPGTAIEAMAKTQYPLAKPSERFTNTLGQNDNLIQNMTPDEFLNKSRPLKIDAESRETINNLKQHIKEGKPLDPLELHANGKEDGRHRAIAAKELGIKEVPVINFRPPAEPFYSALEHNVSKISQNKMTGDQWLGTLSNKPGVKPEEMQWTGLGEFLKENGNKPVTKAQIEEHLAGNKVELKEVNKGGQHLEHRSRYNEEFKDWDIIDNQNNIISSGYRDQRAADREILNLAGHRQSIDAGADLNNGTKYSSYQLPGGENYREMLLTLPQGKEVWDQNLIYYMRKYPQVTNEIKTIEDVALAQKHNPAFRETSKGLSPEEVLATARASEKPANEAYKSSHWDEPNILAHVRMNDRTIDGKKSLHLEEIQSDWHQQGRDKGYKNNLSEVETTELKKLRAKVEDGTLNGDDAVRVAELENKKAAYGGVPDAPFKKSWHEFALKRMIREAAEKGYDRLSWTPGEAQAARYDLSKSISDLSYNPRTKTLVANDKNGSTVMQQKGVEPDKISDFVGKDVAKKLLETKYDKDNPYSLHSLTNTNLKIGGEGMKGFYDKMIPNYLEKLGKEHGVKVKSHMLETNPKGWHITPPSETVSGKWMVKSNDYNSKGFQFETKAEAEANLAQNIAGERAAKPIHYIDIPKSLKDSAMHKGFPLFSSTHMFTPISHDPFEKKK